MAFEKQHVGYIDEHAPALEKKLRSARSAWVKAFWKNSGLAAFKADSTDDSGDGDEPIYFDDADAALTVEEAAAIKAIVSALTGDGYSQALYDEMSLAVEAGWLNGAQLVKEAAKIEAGFDVVPAETLTAIKEKADAFAFMVNAREQQTLFGLIDNAISNGQTVSSLASAIQNAFSQGYHVKNDDMLAAVKADNLPSDTLFHATSKSVSGPLKPGFSLTDDASASIEYLRAAGSGNLYAYEIADGAKIASQDDLEAAGSELDIHYDYAYEYADDQDVLDKLAEQGYDAVWHEDLSPDNNTEHETLRVINPDAVNLVKQYPLSEFYSVIPTDAWSSMVARTELNRAQTFGQMAIYQSAGIQKVAWMSDHGSTVCGRCDQADGTVVVMGDMFEGVDCDSPPAHPQCCCAVVPADEDVISPYVQQMIDDKQTEEQQAA